MTDLDKPIAAVEAGSLPTFPETCRAVGGINAVDVDGAFSGSLDAAHRLHEALLPGWAWTVSGPYASVMDHDGSDDYRNLKLFSAKAEVAARAWLLAVLKALRAKDASNE